VGLRYVYEGNIYSDGANTYCPNARNCLSAARGMMCGESRREQRLPEVRIHDSRCLDERRKREALAKQVLAAKAYGHLNL